MDSADHSFEELCRKIKERGSRPPLTFREFMELATDKPDLIFRNIFQVFHDMIYSHIGEAVDEYPDDPESINYVYYDCTSLFADATDRPFFADRLFANRLISLIASFRRGGTQQNRMYIFEGPHGSGKSTFLNNLLTKFERYTKTDGGASYEIVWRLDKKQLGAGPEQEAHALLTQLKSLVDNPQLEPPGNGKDGYLHLQNKEYIEVPCPSHDNPLLLIPKVYRREVLEEMIGDKEFKDRLFSEKQYEWIFKAKPCTICSSLYKTLLDRLDSPAKVYDMVFARRYLFNRRLGEGISVFNPGDGPMKTQVMTNEQLQHQLNALLRDSNRVRYLYSRYANTNNGVYALMDIKAHNKERFANLHGIISEGVHKVDNIEENVNSLFLALMNPEDHENMQDAQSFSDRITYIKIPYVLDYNTEAKIYKSIFGNQIDSYFLPRVLENFSKVIISSRLSPRSDGLEGWIDDARKYRQYCDANLHLLKMDIYAGLIPPWLSEDDRKRFTAQKRRKIIAESEHEGDKGFSGRDSIKIFNEFFTTYAKKDKLITMAMVHNYFKKHRGGLARSIPEGFLDSLVCSYNYTVLEEVKESLYYYSEENIAREIKNYLFAINFETGRTERSVYTGDELDITESFFEAIECRLLGRHARAVQRLAFRTDIQNQYTSKTLTQEMLLAGKSICETEVFQSLFKRYVYNLKENVLDPFLQNDNFRGAIKDYATEGFKSYDKKIREDVTQLIRNLKNKYGYTEQGAKEACIYVIDGELAQMFPRN